MAISRLDVLEVNYAKLANAATDSQHAIRKQEFDAAINTLSGVAHAPVTSQDSNSASIALAGQQVTVTVRRKTAGLAIGEGELLETVDGLAVRLGTSAYTAAAGNHGHDAATQLVNGFMSAADKAKLDGIAAGATALTLAGSGEALTAARSDHSHADVNAGASGFMSPGMLLALEAAAAVAAGIDERIRDGVDEVLVSTNSVEVAYTDDGSGVGELRLNVRRKITGLQLSECVLDETADGLVARLGTSAYTAAAGNHTHDDATQAVAGFMSASDKAKLDLLSETEQWRDSVESFTDLPLNVDPVGTCRLVRDTGVVYRHVTNVGFLADQWVTLTAVAALDWADVPASSSGTGSAGQQAYDQDYLYVCVDTNTWKRTALATW